LGGLVVKQALVQLLEHRAQFLEGDILQATRALILFGTPSLGLKTEFVRAIVGDNINLPFLLSLERDTSSSYLKRLKKDFTKVREALPQLQIHSYYEHALHQQQSWIQILACGR